MKTKDYVICVDFDGTVVTHKYPEIGDEVPNAVKWLKRFQSMGCKLILNTMRSNGREPLDKNGKIQPIDVLTEAAHWFDERGISLYGINVNPTQKQWTQSPKVYGNIYIDDAAAGCPLIYPLDGGRPYVDWDTVGEIVLKRMTIG